MKVLKFGGSSVANAKNISLVQEIISQAATKEPLITVFSACGDTTDLLLNAGNLAKNGDESFHQIIAEIDALHLGIIQELFLTQNQARVVSELKGKINELEEVLEGVFSLKEFSVKTYDKVLSFGEQLSNFIISEYLKEKGIDAELYNTQEIIKTESVHGGAKIRVEETYQNIRELDLKVQVAVMPGFISSSLETGEATTLGRGGSDYTASLFAGALKAEELQVWKDVDGMLTANPEWVKSAKTIENLTYDEALELSHFGSNVLYPPTVQPALINNIPIRIKNTFNPRHPGTLISRDGGKSKGPVRGISSITEIGLLTISGSEMFGLPGFSKRFFETLSLKGVNVIMITQGSSEHSITVATSLADLAIALKAVNEEFKYEMSNDQLSLTDEEDLSILALVGSQMKNHTGISGKMFGVLGQNGVNIRAIAQGSSETNITAVIAQADLKKALNVLNEAFFESETKEINLFIIGVGNVGAQLIEQIHAQKSHLLEERRLRIKVVGLANSKKMWFAEDIDTDKVVWQKGLEEKGEALDLKSFSDRAAELNLRNSIFVDNTASYDVSEIYESFLEKSIGIVTCNKIAASSEFVRYKNLKRLARDHNAAYLFETNVGAGLPIIDTLKSLVSSGDKIRNIQGVLSGSLNFIFNEFKAGAVFHDVVKEAQKEGYTEPDPRIDLSGVDVARKVLILARESGYELNLEDIENNSFLEQEYFDGSVDDFYELLKENGTFFDELRQKAEDQGKRLKFVGSFENGKGSVGLESVGPEHPFYNVEGKDNIVMLYTDRYPDQPMIIKGAGAGAAVTASGVFADIIRYASI